MVEYNVKEELLYLLRMESNHTNRSPGGLDGQTYINKRGIKHVKYCNDGLQERYLQFGQIYEKRMV